MGRRGFDRMRSAPAAAMIALASATGQARTLAGSRTGAGGMMPCSMQFLMLSVLRGFAVRLRPRHAATPPGREECPEQADLRDAVPVLVIPGRRGGFGVRGPV
jgi:hypothetical protein